MNIELKKEFQGKKGPEALQRLTNIAHGDTHQCKYVRDFLLHMYNNSNTVDLIAILQAVDSSITQDCLTVMVERANTRNEPHNYFESGSEIFKQLSQMNKKEERSNELDSAIAAAKRNSVLNHVLNQDLRPKAPAPEPRGQGGDRNEEEKKEEPRLLL